MKSQAEGAIFPEFKLAEDHLFDGGQKETALSDSQDTEPFIPSDAEVENDISTTATSFSSVTQKNQKRKLPSWFTDEYCVPKKEARGKNKPSNISGKKNASDEKDKKASSSDEANATSQNVRNKGKSRLFEEEVNQKSLLRKRKDGEPPRVQRSVSEAEENPLELEQIPKSKTMRRNTQKLAASSAKHGFPPARKRKRGRKFVESELSEEEEAEVSDDHERLFQANENLTLTTEDLVNLATEHLETEGINEKPAGNDLPGDGAFNDELQGNVVSAPKSKGSIFSVRGWNDIANTGIAAEGALYSQDVTQLAPSFALNVSKHYSQDNTDLNSDQPLLCGDPLKTSDSLGTAENVVDDMLGLIFGPTLSKTASSRLESSQNILPGISQSTAACSDDDMKDVVLPVLNDSVLQPKKKSSLKDKVMMYLG